MAIDEQDEPPNRVATLVYELIPRAPTARFTPGFRGWRGELGSFNCVLALGQPPLRAVAPGEEPSNEEVPILTARSPEVFPTVAAAREAIEPMLRIWESYVELTD